MTIENSLSGKKINHEALKRFIKDQALLAQLLAQRQSAPVNNRKPAGVRF